LDHIEALAGWVLKNGLPKGIALNVNVPALPPEKVPGFKLTRQGLNKFHESFEHRQDPRGNSYYWLSGEVPAGETSEEYDVTALNQGYVSVTPLFYDLTAHTHRKDLECSLKKL